jgi:hypothetical protein
MISIWTKRRCDSCGSQLDSLGMCHANLECCNYSDEWPQSDKDKYDEWRDRQFDKEQPKVNRDQVLRTVR